MITKRDFTEQEWKDLIQVPVAVGMYIIGSDVSLTNMPKEMLALTNAMEQQPAPGGVQDLVTALVADFKATANEKHTGDASANKAEPPKDLEAAVLDPMKKSLAVFDAKATAAERTGFRTWLMELAEATAEAGKEGGFLGIGAVRVSDQEKAALAELKKVLGLA